MARRDDGTRPPIPDADELRSRFGLVEASEEPDPMPSPSPSPSGPVSLPDGERGDGDEDDSASPAPLGSADAGPDPMADSDGFIPLSEALRRISKDGQAPNIIPDWVSSNMFADGEIGMNEYSRLLIAHIERHRQHPPDWDTNKRIGQVYVAGAVDGPSGQILGAKILRSSGDPAIDRAALETLQASSPYPPVGQQGVLQFRMAIRYGPDSPVPR